LGNLGVDGRMLVKEIIKEYEAVDYIHLTEDGDQWRPPVNTVLNLRVS